VLSAGRLTALALLNCLIREVAVPRGLVDTDASWVRIRLPATGRTLRAALRRPSRSEPRLTGQVEHWDDDALGWRPLDWAELANWVDAELTGPSGVLSPELIAEVTASHAFLAEILRLRTISDHQSEGADRIADYLTSEQSLLAGHRFHPAPKARSGPMTEAVHYAPEARTAFRLRYLAVPAELIQQYEVFPGAADTFDQLLDCAPSGHRLLPVHPWQYRILSRGTALPAALASGRLVQLGELGNPVRPTSSVRTVAHTDGTGFLKLSLGVQITNCLRVNPIHEIQAAVIVSRELEPLRAELAKLFPGTLVLAEPASRTVDLGSIDATGELATGLGVIAREGLAGVLPGKVQPLLAAALVEPVPTAPITAVLDLLSRDRQRLIDWWDGYLARLLPPVPYAFLAHGVVFEAHLQNVVVGLAESDARPEQVVLRDLEGVKLVGPRHGELLAGLPPQVREHLGYSASRGWDRVAYCLFVNNVSSVLSMLTDLDPGVEGSLWSRVRSTVQAFRTDHGDAPQLRDILTGMPLPAKTNLLTRWHRTADRDSGYVPVQLPIVT
jgi:siderophore synthetase component